MNINSILDVYGSGGIFSNYGVSSINSSTIQTTETISKADSYQPSQASFMSRDMYDYSSTFSKLSKLKNEVNSINTASSVEVVQEPNTQVSSSTPSGSGSGGSSNKSEGETKTEIKNINGQLYKVVTITYEDGTTETTTTAIGSIKNNNNSDGEVSNTADLVEALTM